MKTKHHTPIHEQIKINDSIVNSITNMSNCINSMMRAIENLTDRVEKLERNSNVAKRDRRW